MVESCGRYSVGFEMVN